MFNLRGMQIKLFCKISLDFVSLKNFREIYKSQKPVSKLQFFFLERVISPGEHFSN